MSHPDYRASDFDPPLSDDAAIMLGFLQEKKRKLARLRAGFLGATLGAFLVGVTVGMWFGNLHLTP